MTKTVTHYFLTHAPLGEEEVTEQEFIQAERAAGFFPKFGSDGPATGGFSNSQLNISGRVEFITEVNNG